MLEQPGSHTCQVPADALQGVEFAKFSLYCTGSYNVAIRE